MPSKKRWIAISSVASGSPIEKTRTSSPWRSTHEITITRCRCGGRKSLFDTVRRFWKATSATSASGSSSGKLYKRRMPATSGIVSISKARTGVIRKMGSDQLYWQSSTPSDGNVDLTPLIGEDAGRQVAVAAVADDGDDDGVLQVARDAERHVHGAAGGDAGEDALLAREAPRHFLRVALAHVLEAIDA